MNKRAFIALLIVGFGLILVGFSFTETRPGYAQEGGTSEQAALQGSVLYAQYCVACHGAEGEAIGTNSGFVSIANYDPNFVRGRIINGYDSNGDDDVAMLGYGEDAEGDKGPLSDSEVSDLMAYMATWNNAEVETPPLPRPNLEPGDREVVGPGNAEEGAIIYAYSCLGCHGRDAQGVEGLKNFPAFTIDENSIRVVATGDGHSVVPAFAESNGGPLAQEELDNLQAYLDTIEVDEEEEGPQGVSILIIVLGLGAVLAVGGAYMASRGKKS